MKFHEYQAKEILRKHGLPVPWGRVAATPTEAEFNMLHIQRRLKYPSAVVKAQIHAGGRGKAGGVKLVHAHEECARVAASLLGKKLVTPQTGSEGKLVTRVYVEQASKIEKEYYLALLIDRSRPAITIVASTEGGMDIEEVAARTPDKVVKVYIDPRFGLQSFYLHGLIIKLGLQGTPLACEFYPLVENLYKVFRARDLSLLEINPLAVVDGKFSILDTKMVSDDNASFRQDDFRFYRDYAEENDQEMDASKSDLTFISLPGDIGCIVNGAGLAMATMDIVKRYGGEPANFVDLGGGSSEEQVRNAFRIVLKDKGVKVILVNIFGGIMRCDVIANALIAAVSDLGLSVPLVIRLQGTNVEKGREILKASGISLISVNDMREGAEKAIALTRKSENQQAVGGK